MIKFLLLLTFSNIGVFCASQFSPCTRDDERCLVTLLQDMYDTVLQKSLDTDPMYQELIDDSLPSLNFTMEDATLKGLKDCEINNVSFSPEDTIMNLIMSCPWLNITGHYNMEGSIETEPFYTNREFKNVSWFIKTGQYNSSGTLQPIFLEGKGKFEIVTKDYEIRLQMKLKFNEKQGQNYMKIVKFQAESDYKKENNIDFWFQNLKDSNEKSSASDNETRIARFGNGWIKLLIARLIVIEVLPKPIFDVYIQKFINIFNKEFENIPVPGIVV